MLVSMANVVSMELTLFVFGEVIKIFQPDINHFE